MTDNEMAARATLTIAISRLVGAVMGWNEKKANEWMMTENPHLGGKAPAQLVMRGRSHKVLAFVEASIEENAPPRTEPEKKDG